MESELRAKKARYWRKVIQEAARSGVSIREFCRQRQLAVSQFYWWQRRLQPPPPPPPRAKKRVSASPAASFVLVSEPGQGLDAGIELVLGDGRRLRIHKGVDETTLRAVLAAPENSGC
jgi:hypothetical protein